MSANPEEATHTVGTLSDIDFGEESMPVLADSVYDSDTKQR